MTDDEILNAIREKRFVVAKREINSKVSRFPQKNFYRILNAFLLLSTGSTNEALDECNKIKPKVPNDPKSLDLLHEIYCKLGRKIDANQIYETASKKYPSTELMSNWYNKSVQAFDAKMMQESATAFKKSFPLKREIHLKSAFADFIYSKETNIDEESQKLLTSALDTMKGIEPLQTNQEAFLYSSLLMERNEFSKVIELLEPLKNKELELVLLLLDALCRGSQWDKLFSYSYDLLFNQSFNDFDTWKYLIKAGHALGKLHDILYSLIKFDSRNSFVANIELSRVYGTNVENSMNVYYEKFRAKPCCAADLSSCAISDTFKTKILAQKSALLEKAQLSDDEAAICINIEKLLLLSDGHRIVWDTYAKYDNPDFSELYLAFMIQSFEKELSTKMILEHIIRLQKFADLDPENFNVKLWLLNLYSTISGSAMALKTYEDLKIKMIQHDVTSYKLNLEPSTKNLNQLLQIYRFYLTAEDEMSAFVSVALDRGLYTKVQDLYIFGKRLRNSISRHLLILQISKMCRMLNSEYLGYFLNLLCDSKTEVLSDDFSVSDNRDFKTDYKLGFKLQPTPIFAAEAKKSKEYVQLLYLKELVIFEDKDHEKERLVRLYERWLSDSAHIASMPPSELHFYKLSLALFKLTKLSSVKDRELQFNYLTKNLEFKRILQGFLGEISPMSSSANRILVDSLELVKLINLLLNEELLKALGKKFQQGLVQYIVTNPEMKYFKEVKTHLEVESLPKSFVDTQLDLLEDGIRTSKFKMR